MQLYELLPIGIANIYPNKSKCCGSNGSSSKLALSCMTVQDYEARCITTHGMHARNSLRSKCFDQHIPELVVRGYSVSNPDVANLICLSVIIGCR
jgi:hypothetical protein